MNSRALRTETMPVTVGRHLTFGGWFYLAGGERSDVDSIVS